MVDLKNIDGSFVSEKRLQVYRPYDHLARRSECSEEPSQLAQSAKTHKGTKHCH